ncbi:MAG: hypothetical protein M3O46_09650 [Myxococcota bacterium]|nr:hypothetical protein [Myxococcota bacterium]
MQLGIAGMMQRAKRFAPGFWAMGDIPIERRGCVALRVEVRGVRGYRTAASEVAAFSASLLSS